MSHDVFISYTSWDKAAADAVCGFLEGQGIRCWMAPRDIPTGTDWPTATDEAIKASRAMALVFSGSANSSAQIKREVVAAASHRIPIVPIMIEQVTPAGTLQYHLRFRRRLDVFSKPLEENLELVAAELQAEMAKKPRSPDEAPKKENVVLEQLPTGPQVTGDQAPVRKPRPPTIQKPSRWKGGIERVLGIVIMTLGIVCIFSFGGGIGFIVMFVLGLYFFSLGLREINSGSKIFGIVALGLGLLVLSQHFVVGIGSYALCFVGLAVYRRGKRHCAITAHELLGRKDQRPPVVYLRSFKADKETRKGTIYGDFRTEEEVLAEVLNQIGPVVAIGKPGEELPELGAARLYVADSEWQQVVHSHLERARLVVLRLGATKGFWWEMEHSIKNLQPSQLVLLVPSGKAQYNAFREKAAAYLPHQLPEYVESKNLGKKNLSSLRSLRGLVYFEADWKSVFVDIADFKGRLDAQLRQGLRPVFARIKAEKGPRESGLRLEYVVVPLMVPLASLLYYLIIRMRMQ